MSRYRQDEFCAFSEYDGHSFLESQKQLMLQDIAGQRDDYILNANQTEYINHLVDKYTISPLEIHADQLSVSTEERLIPAERHPWIYDVHDGKSYPRDLLIFHLPFSGDPDLLKVRASTFSVSAPRISIAGEEIRFEIINFDLDADTIKRESENIVRQLASQNSHLTKDLGQFNASLNTDATKAFEARKAHLLSKNDLLSSLGVPIRRSADTPATFAVPAKKTSAITAQNKPAVHEKGYKPEPALDETIYRQILQIIHDVGKQFERLPSTYAGKDEEHLRDHLLLILEPNFEGSATGETFNKKGKTDILLRHEGSNVFVAELKYWQGKKAYIETITQLLAYLTWRDSKAAVTLFVSNKDFSAVLDSIQDSTKEHPNYLGFVETVMEGWYQYRLHINGDPNREVSLAVQAFHIP